MISQKLSEKTKESFSSSFAYSKFLAQIIFKKKSTIVIPIIAFLLTIILTIIAHFVGVQNRTEPSVFLIISYIVLFINLFITVIFASIKSLNLFKDLAKEGMDILIFSKTITRKNVITTKLGFFAFLGVLWSFLVFISLIIFYASNYPFSQYVNHWYVSAFFSPLFAFIIFGLFVALIALKGSSKIAMVVPLVTFAPLLVVGSIASIFQTPASNALAKELEHAYPNYDSGTILNAEKFYFNNNQDQLFIIPKRTVTPLKDQDVKTFTDRQNQYLSAAYNQTKDAAAGWQAISWLSIPYQLIDVFAKRDQDPVNIIADKEEKNLNKYLYYNKNSSRENKYQINKQGPEFIKFNVVDKDQTYSRYIVPGLLRARSVISQNTLDNSEIIYAREGADNQNAIFNEDNNIFASPDNLVGKINWPIVKDTLSSSVFNEKAEEFYQREIVGLKSKTDILTAIAKIVDKTYDQNFINLVDNNSPSEVLKIQMDPRKVANLTEKKIYLVTSMIYYIYFNHNSSNSINGKKDGEILDLILRNSDPAKGYTPEQIFTFIDNNKYYIGGYKSYQQIQVPKTVNGQRTIVYRFGLDKSNNHLFQDVDEVYIVEPKQQVVIKGWFSIIWIITAAAMLVGAYYAYTRKDYR